MDRRNCLMKPSALPLDGNSQTTCIMKKQGSQLSNPPYQNGSSVPDGNQIDAKAFHFFNDTRQKQRMLRWLLWWCNLLWARISCGGGEGRFDYTGWAANIERVFNLFDHRSPSSFSFSLEFWDKHSSLPKHYFPCRLDECWESLFMQDLPMT